MRYYIAYGSNLSSSQMKYRCKDAKLVGTGVLEDYVLEFKSVGGKNYNAFATVTKCAGRSVPVAVFVISETDEKSLDIYEGVRGHHYYKKEVKVNIKNKEITGLIYIMNEHSDYAIPSSHYTSVVACGYLEHGFDLKILTSAFSKSADNLNG